MALFRQAVLMRSFHTGRVTRMAAKGRYLNDVCIGRGEGGPQKGHIRNGGCVILTMTRVVKG